MPSKATIAQRKLIHAQQVVDNKAEWLCVRCNTDRPKDEFLTKRNGYRLKCKSCAETEAKANATYRLKHAEKVAENSRYYEEQRKRHRQDIIEKHKKMVNDRCSVIMCTKCKLTKPTESFRNHTRRITRHCYECRQASQVIESRRPPDTRARKPRVAVKTEHHYSCHKYCTYRRNDITKGFFKTKEEFEKMLPRSYAYKMMQTPCTYCNTYEPSKIGLDRVDSTKPHTMYNVVSCCETCNIAKSTMGIAAYTSHIKKIATVTRYWKSPTGIYECPF